MNPGSNTIQAQDDQRPLRELNLENMLLFLLNAF